MKSNQLLMRKEKRKRDLVYFHPIVPLIIVMKIIAVAATT